MRGILNSSRAVGMSRQLILKYDLDLTGLTVLTEAASGSYLDNPMIPIIAGAERVITFCRDSKYGTADSVYHSMLEHYSQAGLGDRFDWVTELNAEIISSADIVTNSGHLRPIDKRVLQDMQSTAVIPLMWEPWEMRPGEIDLDFAQQKGILIMGTNEHEPPCDMRPYSFLTALHLAMSHKTSLVDDRILVLGEQYLLALPIENGFRQLGIPCRRILPICTPEVAAEAVAWATYIIVAEHVHHAELIGREGLIKTSQLVDANITGVGVIAGLVDRDDIEAHGISVYPEHIAPPGFMSYMSSVLGSYPVMDLFTAGLKVGQEMARSKLEGQNNRDTALNVIKTSPAMDLEGEYSWI